MDSREKVFEIGNGILLVEGLSKNYKSQRMIVADLRWLATFESFRLSLCVNSIAEQKQRTVTRQHKTLVRRF